MQHSAVIYTRDERVPLDDDDRDMEYSWRCVPVPPTADSIWVIVDSSKDNATGWCRRCIRHDEMQDRLPTKPEPAPAIEDRFRSAATTAPPPAIAAPAKKRRRRKPPPGQLTFDFRRKN
jgi:hypothetical protein